VFIADFVGAAHVSKPGFEVIEEKPTAAGGVASDERSSIAAAIVTPRLAAAAAPRGNASTRRRRVLGDNVTMTPPSVRAREDGEIVVGHSSRVNA
jgi:hypothetical protein